MLIRVCVGRATRWGWLLNGYCACIGHLEFLALPRAVLAAVVVLSFRRHRRQKSRSPVVFPIRVAANAEPEHFDDHDGLNTALPLPRTKPRPAHQHKYTEAPLHVVHPPQRRYTIAQPRDSLQPKETRRRTPWRVRVSHCWFHWSCILTPPILLGGGVV